MINTEESKSIKKIYDGKIINVEVHDVLVNGQKMHKREIVKHAKGVGILVLDNDSNFILVEQFRKPFDKGVIEIPAGKVDEGEEILDAAVRELSEEIGYKSNNMVFLGEFYPSPGFTDEIVYLYYADDLIEYKLKADDDENFNIIKYNYKEMESMIKDNKLKDGKTLTAFLYYQLRVKNERD